MPIDSNNGDFDGEIFDEETANERKRDTDPNIGIALAYAARNSVATISQISQMPRENEIIQKICADAGLTEDDMTNPKMICGGGKITLAEYYFESTGNCYLYSIDNKWSPVLKTRHKRGRDKKPSHIGPAVLWKVDRKAGNKKVLHRWE